MLGRSSWSRWSAEVLGSLAGYLIGYFGGRPLVDRVGKVRAAHPPDLDRAEAWFARRGEPFVLFGRFIPLLRSFVSFAAGLGEMAVAKFLVFTLIGCAIWCTALTSLGLLPGHQLQPCAQGVQRRRARGRGVGRDRGGRPLLPSLPGRPRGAQRCLTRRAVAASRPARRPERGPGAGDSTNGQMAAGHIERSDRWNGLRPGDPVRVSGVAMRGATWRFRAHVRNLHNGHESVEVVGGRHGDRTIRSFSPDRIFPAATSPDGGRGGSGRPTARLPSLAEAPRLPLE